jgi:NitT/TauT family transport system substrate-binding protein
MIGWFASGRFRREPLGSALLQFYRGAGPDAAGRKLEEIWAWDDFRLETAHDYVQWLFPLPEPSRFNDAAPLLSAADIAAFRASPELQANLRRSLDRILAFYGFERDEGRRIVPRADFALQARNWLTPNNHNFLRLSRVLRALTHLGLEPEALALLAALEALYRDSSAAIGERSLAFWRAAVAPASRRGPGAVIALALCVAATVSAPASADTTLRVGKASATSDAIIPVNVGDELGIFRKHGLALAIIDFGGGSKMAQAMAAGDIDIGDGAGTEMAFVAKGAPMIAVCESTAPAPFLGIGVPWDSAIKSLADLKGKIIGVSSPGSFSDWSGHELARKEGWGEDGVTTVAIGGGTAPTLAALRTHQVDAVISTTSIFLAFEEAKYARLIAPVSSYEGNVASGALYASNRLIAENVDAIRAFLAAWIETVDYMRTHKAETVKIESRLNQFDEAVMSREYDLTIGMFTRDCRFDADSLATLKRSFRETKLVEGDPDMSKLYTESYLPK